MTNINIEVDDEIHARFKAECALEMKDMKDILIDFMKKYKREK